MLLLHAPNGCKYVKLKCPICNNIFDKEKRQTHLRKKKNVATFCSRSCSAKFSKNKVSIENNVIEEYIKYR